MSAIIPTVTWQITGSPSHLQGVISGAPRLEEALNRHRESIRAAYSILPGTPYFSHLWHRLWMDSPLSAERTAALTDVLRDHISTHPNDIDLVEFLRGLEACIDSGASMEVCLSPAGHADFGVTVRFAHCPRCKLPCGEGMAMQSAEETTTCELCGTVFKPSETSQSKPWT